MGKRRRNAKVDDAERSIAEAGHILRAIHAIAQASEMSLDEEIAAIAIDHLSVRAYHLLDESLGKLGMIRMGAFDGASEASHG